MPEIAIKIFPDIIESLVSIRGNYSRYDGAVRIEMLRGEGLQYAVIDACVAIKKQGFHYAAFKTGATAGPKTIDEIVTILSSRYYGSNGLPSVGSFDPSVTHAIRLLAWQNMPHFVENPQNHAERSCTLCGQTQHGVRGPSWDNGGFQPYQFPHWCTNPVCLSHDIERLVDPSYEPPWSIPVEETFVRVLQGPQPQ